MRYPSAGSGSAPRLAASACVLAAAAISLSATPAAGPAATAAPQLRTESSVDSRVAQADAYLKTRPGVTGYVLRDRKTGAVRANAHANDLIWTASTIKLAIAADLLGRQRVGAISLPPQDRTLMEQMLATSNDQAADILWAKYCGPDRMAFNNAFRSYGMTSLAPYPPRSGAAFPDWSFQKSTAADFDRLMVFIFDKMNPDDRNYLLDRMRQVDPNQHWGVWGAGAGMRPGLKNGWSAEEGGWVVNSVGFAGPNERYSLAIMTSLNEGSNYTVGADTDTHIAGLLLAGG